MCVKILRFVLSQYLWLEVEVALMGASSETRAIASPKR